MNIHYTRFTQHGYFGNYPTQEIVQELENIGVTYFIDLTTENEKGIVKYNTTKKYYAYPISDMSFPDIESFYDFVIMICDVMRTETVYIHCKGGHGRSGILVACILIVMNQITPMHSIYLTTTYHNMRDMKLKWKRIGSPQTNAQKNFVHRFYNKYIIN